MSAAQLLSASVTFGCGLVIGAVWAFALVVRRPGLLGLKPEDERHGS